MYNEAAKFHKIAFPIFLAICLVFLLTGCAAFPVKSQRLAPQIRTTRLLVCIHGLLNKGITAKSSHSICKDIYKRGE